MDVATLSEPDTKAFLLGAQSHRSFKLCDDHFVWIGLGGGAGEVRETVWSVMTREHFGERQLSQTAFF